MSFTMQFRTQVITGDGQFAIDNTVDVVVDALDSRSAVIGVGTDVNVLLAFGLATLKGYCFSADGDLTLETNTITGPAVPMKKGVPLVWYQDCGYAKHFTVDVTTCYFTNAGTVPVNLEIRVGKDSTP